MLRKIAIVAIVVACAAAQRWGVEDDEDAPKEPTPGTFMVTAPSVVRPDRPYAVSLLILESRDNNHVVRVNIHNAQNQTIAFALKNNVKRGVPTTITIDKVDARKLVPGAYKLYVKAETAAQTVLFEKSTDISFDQKSMSVFVQTDKAVYKPGDTVKMRAVLVDAELKPIDDKVHLKVYDPNRNLIVQRTNRSLTMGVISDELPLSAQTALGDWTINVETMTAGIEHEDTFSVEKYVLPKFEVELEPPAFLTNDMDAQVLIKAKYTYGKGVQGKAHIVASDPYAPFLYPTWEVPIDLSVDEENVGAPRPVGVPRPPPPQRRREISKTVTLSNTGEALVTFTKKELTAAGLMTTDGSQSIKFYANVTEQLTGIARETEETLAVHKYPALVTLDKSTDSFKPGLKYAVTVSLTQPDNSPLPAGMSRRVQVYEEYNFAWRPDNEQRKTVNRTQTVDVDASGKAVVQLDTVEGAENMRVEAKYDHTGENNFAKVPRHTQGVFAQAYVEAANSPSDSYMQLSASKTRGSVGERIAFNIRTTDTLKNKKAIATIMSRGVMIWTKEVPVPSKAGTVTVTLSAAMAPASRMLVWGIVDDDTNEILVDAVDFDVAGLMENSVSVSLNKKQAEPGAEVTVSVDAAANSYVALLGVDQSVRLLRTGNDITADMVEDDIRAYQSTGGGHIGPSPFWGRRKRSWYPWWISGKDAKEVFNNAGIAVITDALLYSEPRPPMLYRAMEVDCPNCGNMPPPPPNAMSQEEDDASDLTAASSSSSAPTPKTRSKFDETWLWFEGAAKANGKLSYKATVPDTITSWVVSAFAVSQAKGLGVAEKTAEMKTFRPFFIRANLPYAVKRGEQLALQVLVFNYEETPQTVTLTLAHTSNEHFAFIDKAGRPLAVASAPKDYNRRQVTVPGGGGSTSVLFPLVMNKIGQVELDITAMGSTSSDRIKQKLKVEPEGYKVDKNTPVLVDLSENTNFKREVRLDFPTEAVDGSQWAYVNVAGDMLGPVMSNLDSLVQMPYGCGEQNMVNFVPNIVVVKYMKATDQVDVNIMNKAVKFMESGYQRELTYKRSDDSFSAFGDSDETGSTWLTAFVVRSFKKAEPHIFVDKEIMAKSINYLNTQQTADGEFKERGEVHHKDMQGGASEGGVPMTAYVTLTMLENDVPAKKAIAYLEANLDKVADEPYALALTTYCLTLAKSSKAEEAWNKLELLKKETDGEMWWEDKVGEEPEGEQYYWNRPRPVNVEMTAYALLTRVARDEIAESLPIVKWLSNQRSATGGWSSTQDTVVALQALAEYAEKAYDPTFNVDIKMTNGDDSHTFSVTPANALVYQQYQLTNLDAPVTLEATGSGIVFATVQYAYHLTRTRRDMPFDCSRDVIQPANGASEMTIALCCKYQKPGKSNMALLEMNALSGFEFEESALNVLPSQIKTLQRVETEKDGAKANIYFKELSADPVCMNVTSQMVYQVADQKDADMVLFDYYEPTERVELTYSARQKRSIQSVCGDDCWGNPVVLEAQDCRDTIRLCSRVRAKCATDALVKRRCRATCGLC